MRRWRRRLGRLPRPVFWMVGAAIACGGALTARLYAEHLPLEERLPFWLIGGGLVFLGMAVLSLGTRARLDGRSDEDKPQ